MLRPHPHSRSNLEEITARNENARHMIAGFASATPTLAGAWRFIDTALADVPAVLAELERARADLVAVRLNRANLLAAIRAALAASAEGEADPLWYLRDELAAHDTSQRASQTLSDGSWGQR